MPNSSLRASAWHKATRPRTNGSEPRLPRYNNIYYNTMGTSPIRPRVQLLSMPANLVVMNKSHLWQVTGPS
jgi:hypothetical protein